MKTLTWREQEIVDLLCEGLLPAEVAARLNIRKRTMDFHLQNIYDKSGVHSVTQIYADELRRLKAREAL